MSDRTQFVVEHFCFTCQHAMPPINWTPGVDIAHGCDMDAPDLLPTGSIKAGSVNHYYATLPCAAQQPYSTR